MEEQAPTMTAGDDLALLTYTEAADVLHMTTQTLRRLVATGEIGHVRFGRRILFRPSQLDEFIDRHSSGRHD